MTREGNKDWNDGFFDGYNGKPFRDGANDDYGDGYNRGYATAEAEDAAVAWRAMA